MSDLTTERIQCGPYVSVSMFDPPYVSVGSPHNPTAQQLRELAGNCIKAAEILEGKVHKTREYAEGKTPSPVMMDFDSKGHLLGIELLCVMPTPKADDLRAQLAHTIAEKRQEKGLSQAELARRINTKQQVISNIETLRHANITLETLQKIAIALDAKLSISFR